LFSYISRRRKRGLFSWLYQLLWRGTWEDARRNEEIQNDLEQLAKSGNDIRDRGAFLDAWLGGADVFVTSDKQLVGTGPSKRIQVKFQIRVLWPADLANELCASP
jgi:hypothetical protein